MTDTVVLECQKLCKEFTIGTETITVLDNIDLRITSGQSLAIIGTSGAGKTTLLTLLGGLDVPTSGQVLVLGENINTISERKRTQLRGQQIGFVYQFHHLLHEFTALENVQLPLMMCSVNAKQSVQRATEMLARVGLQDRLNHKPAELSGGERQRVAIARSLVNQPACVLLDEPTGNLDQANREVVHALLTDLNSDLGVSFVLVTHDTGMTHNIGQVLRLHMGKLENTKKSPRKRKVDKK